MVLGGLDDDSREGEKARSGKETRSLREAEEEEDDHNILAERFKTIEEEDDRMFLTNNGEATTPRKLTEN